MPSTRKNPHAVALGRLGGLAGGAKGGAAGWAKLTPAERSERARSIVAARWSKAKKPATKRKPA